jgi:flavodoxin I
MEITGKGKVAMKALVLYDSVFGNTEKVAQAIAAALGSPDEVACLRVRDANHEKLQGLSLLVVGSPTRGFRPTAALSKFLKNIPSGGLAGMKVAAFDTRIPPNEIKSSPAILQIMIKIFGYADKRIAGMLTKKGGQMVGETQGFFVHGTEGPLYDGELERAAEWARKLVQS